MAGKRLTHFDRGGNAIMVDVTEKAVTERTAVATGSVVMKPATLKAILGGGIKKGDVFAVARLAGIMAAKRTHELIPLCHPLALSAVSIELTADRKRHAVDITATVKIAGKTGVEMEALTAVSVAALTIYDMCKSSDRSMSVGELALWEKTGGSTGIWRRPAL